MAQNFSRRDLLKTAGVAAAATMLGSTACATSKATSEPTAAGRKKVLTVAHITDIHVKPTPVAEAGMRACLKHINARAERPDVIFNGGDLIMDALGATAEKTQIQWDLAKKILSEENTIQIEHCIGNHDIWGWHKEDAKTTGSEPLYGKAWVLKELNLANRYRSFDRAGWHFIVLDSVQDRGDGGYKPVIDEEQFAWLEKDLAATDPNTPIAMLSHVPIMGVGPYFFKEEIVVNYQFNVIGALMHQDVHRLKTLFFQHKNIRLCLSGHVHLLDDCTYNGIRYISNGAVCGNWWSGDFHETKPGYAIVTLYDDGTADNEYIAYG
ncbi:metallophosphoesterase [soil metagenome]